MKIYKYLAILVIGLIGSVSLTGCDEIYIDGADCVGTWYVTYNYDSWGNYDDGGIMVLYYNGEYDYYYSEWNYTFDRVGYYGRWWIDGNNLIYTNGRDTYSYRISYWTYDRLRLRNNMPPGDTEVWFRY